MVRLGNSWDSILADEFKKDYYLQLREFLKAEYSTRVIYPDMYSIFNALKYTPCEEVKAVIIGQDPYHEPGQAHGLCFSVQDGTPLPPSLKNIYKELWDDLGVSRTSGCLTDWAQQGVMLLNAVLTVRQGQAGSPCCFPALGRLCAQEKSAHNQSSAPHFRGRASKPAFCL